MGLVNKDGRLNIFTYPRWERAAYLVNASLTLMDPVFQEPPLCSRLNCFLMTSWLAPGHWIHTKPTVVASSDHCYAGKSPLYTFTEHKMCPLSCPKGRCVFANYIKVPDFTILPCPHGGCHLGHVHWWPFWTCEVRFLSHKFASSLIWSLVVSQW